MHIRTLNSPSSLRLVELITSLRRFEIEKCATRSRDARVGTPSSRSSRRNVKTGNGNLILRIAEQI